MGLISAALAKPKRIELRDYNIGATTIEGCILAAFGAGGGSGSAVCDDKFWKDIDTDRPLRFVIYTDLAGRSDGIMEFNNYTVMRVSSDVAQVSFESVFYFKAYYKLQVVINKLGDTVNVGVKIDTLTFPEFTG